MICEFKKEFVRVAYAGESSWACVVVCRGVRYMLTRKTFFQGANYPADALVMVFYKGYATPCRVEIHYVDRMCGEVAAMIGFREDVNENRHCVLPQCLFIFMLLCRNLLRFVGGVVLRNKANEFFDIISENKGESVMSEMMKLFNVPAGFVKRKHAEKDALPPFRNEFMRDRDRLMYATAFRRLAGKTQIYTVGSDDHKKNRLTHSLEVAQIARTIARALELNEDLTEAIALGHDFGHTPFGHAGEEVLNSIMIPNAELVKGSPFYHKSLEEIESRFQRECRNDCDKKEGQREQVCLKKCENLNQMFGFKHNHQSVRVCAVLEDSYRDNGNNIGLNLTNYVLCGMMLHTKQKYDGTDYPNYQNALSEHIKIKDKDEQAWSFEAYIVSRADDIAQWHHDLEDAIREGVLPPDKICETVISAIGDAMDDEAKKDIEELREGNNADRYSLARLSHIVVNTLVNDLVFSSEKRFEVIYEENLKKNSVDGKGLFSEYEKQEFSIARDRVIDFSEKIKPAEFKDKIREAIHHSRNVERMNEKGKYIIRKLFEAYYAHPQQLTDGAILQVLIESGQKGYETIEDAQKHSKGESRILFDKLMKNPNIMVETILMRRICDHIASMTDHYAIEEYNNLYG